MSSTRRRKTRSPVGRRKKHSLSDRQIKIKKATLFDHQAAAAQSRSKVTDYEYNNSMAVLAEMEKKVNIKREMVQINDRVQSMMDDYEAKQREDIYWLQSGDHGTRAEALSESRGLIEVMFLDFHKLGMSKFQCLNQLNSWFRANNTSSAQMTIRPATEDDSGDYPPPESSGEIVDFSAQMNSALGNMQTMVSGLGSCQDSLSAIFKKYTRHSQSTITKLKMQNKGQQEKTEERLRESKALEEEMKQQMEAFRRQVRTAEIQVEHAHQMTRTMEAKMKKEQEAVQANNKELKQRLALLEKMAAKEKERERAAEARFRALEQETTIEISRLNDSVITLTGERNAAQAAYDDTVSRTRQMEADVKRMTKENKDLSSQLRTIRDETAAEIAAAKAASRKQVLELEQSLCELQKKHASTMNKFVAVKLQLKQSKTKLRDTVEEMKAEHAEQMAGAADKLKALNSAAKDAADAHQLRVMQLKKEAQDDAGRGRMEKERLRSQFELDMAQAKEEWRQEREELQKALEQQGPDPDTLAKLEQVTELLSTAQRERTRAQGDASKAAGMVLQLQGELQEAKASVTAAVEAAAEAARVEVAAADYEERLDPLTGRRLPSKKEQELWEDMKRRRRRARQLWDLAITRLSLRSKLGGGGAGGRRKLAELQQSRTALEAALSDSQEKLRNEVEGQILRAAEVASALKDAAEENSELRHRVRGLEELTETMRQQLLKGQGSAEEQLLAASIAISAELMQHWVDLGRADPALLEALIQKERQLRDVERQLRDHPGDTGLHRQHYNMLAVKASLRDQVVESTRIVIPDRGANLARIQGDMAKVMSKVVAHKELLGAGDLTPSTTGGGSGIHSGPLSADSLSDAVKFFEDASPRASARRGSLSARGGSGAGTSRGGSNSGSNSASPRGGAGYFSPRTPLDSARTSSGGDSSEEDATPSGGGGGDGLHSASHAVTLTETELSGEVEPEQAVAVVLRLREALRHSQWCAATARQRYQRCRERGRRMEAVIASLRNRIVLICKGGGGGEGSGGDGGGGGGGGTTISSAAAHIAAKAKATRGGGGGSGSPGSGSDSDEPFELGVPLFAQLRDSHRRLAGVAEAPESGEGEPVPLWSSPEGDDGSSQLQQPLGSSRKAEAAAEAEAQAEAKAKAEAEAKAEATAEAEAEARAKAEAEAEVKAEADAAAAAAASNGEAGLRDSAPAPVAVSVAAAADDGAAPLPLLPLRSANAASAPPPAAATPVAKAVPDGNGKGYKFWCSHCGTEQRIKMPRHSRQRQQERQRKRQQQQRQRQQQHSARRMSRVGNLSARSRRSVARQQRGRRGTLQVGMAHHPAPASAAAAAAAKAAAAAAKAEASHQKVVLHHMGAHGKMVRAEVTRSATGAIEGVIMDEVSPGGADGDDTAAAANLTASRLPPGETRDQLRQRLRASLPSGKGAQLSGTGSAWYRAWGYEAKHAAFERQKKKLSDQLKAARERIEELKEKVRKKANKAKPVAITRPRGAHGDVELLLKSISKLTNDVGRDTLSPEAMHQGVLSFFVEMRSLAASQGIVLAEDEESDSDSDDSGGGRDKRRGGGEGGAGSRNSSLPSGNSANTAFSPRVPANGCTCPCKCGKGGKGGKGVGVGSTAFLTSVGGGGGEGGGSGGVAAMPQGHLMTRRALPATGYSVARLQQGGRAASLLAESRCREAALREEVARLTAVATGERPSALLPIVRKLQRDIVLLSGVVQFLVDETRYLGAQLKQKDARLRTALALTSGERQREWLSFAAARSVARAVMTDPTVGAGVGRGRAAAAAAAAAAKGGGGTTPSAAAAAAPDTASSSPSGGGGGSSGTSAFDLLASASAAQGSSDGSSGNSSGGRGGVSSGGAPVVSAGALQETVMHALTTARQYRVQAMSVTGQLRLARSELSWLRTRGHGFGRLEVAEKLVARSRRLRASKLSTRLKLFHGGMRLTRLQQQLAHAQSLPNPDAKLVTALQFAVDSAKARVGGVRDKLAAVTSELSSTDAMVRDASDRVTTLHESLNAEVCKDVKSRPPLRPTHVLSDFRVDNSAPGTSAATGFPFHTPAAALPPILTAHGLTRATTAPAGIAADGLGGTAAADSPLQPAFSSHGDGSGGSGSPALLAPKRSTLARSSPWFLSATDAASLDRTQRAHGVKGFGPSGVRISVGDAALLAQFQQHPPPPEPTTVGQRRKQQQQQQRLRQRPRGVDKSPLTATRGRRKGQQGRGGSGGKHDGGSGALAPVDGLMRRRARTSHGSSRPRPRPRFKSAQDIQDYASRYGIGTATATGSSGDGNSGGSGQQEAGLSSATAPPLSRRRPGTRG